MLLRELAGALGRLDLTGRAVLVASSGGLDSTSLVCALHELSQKHGLELSIGHVNHGLRGAESEADEAAVLELARDLTVPARSARVDPRALRQVGPSRDRPTLQEAARQLRYAALRGLAADLGAERIATAHTADDQAETVLLRLLRGTGPDGLGGIPERSPDGRIVRPLLRVTRADLESFARQRGLAWREDSSNASLDYARNRLRLRWLPGLAADFNPRLLRAVADLAEAQRRDSEWIRAEVQREADWRFCEEEGWLRVDVKEWEQLPEALARRLARAALDRCGAARHTTRVHIDRVLAFLRNGRRGTYIELPGDLRLERNPAGFRMGPLRHRPSARDGQEGAC